MRFQNKTDLKDAEEIIEESDPLSNISRLNQHLRDYDADDVFHVVRYASNDPGSIDDDNLVNILELEKLFSVT